MSTWSIASLNPVQRKIVEHKTGPALVIAGAGSGKTRVITHRVAQLIHSGIPASSILLLTFTNKAANEMAQRVGRALKNSTEQQKIIHGTFHSVGSRFLRRNAKLLNYNNNFSILDSSDSRDLIKASLAETVGKPDKYFPKAAVLQNMFSLAFNRFCTQKMILDQPYHERSFHLEQLISADFPNFEENTETILNILAAYRHKKKRGQVMDFDDLLENWLELLLRHGEGLPLCRQIQYILVDEYQDTNQVQYLWLRLLAQARKNICVVGDDDQSIYSWRGAEVANILKFEKDFPGAAVIKLEQNYRSTPQILAAASGLIDANSERLGKTLWTELPAGDKVRVIGVWDAPEEARRVGEEIERLEAEGAPLDEVAILVRAQYQTREFEDRFIQIGLNYRIVGGFRFYERAEIRDALAYLRTIAQPADDLAFERIYNQPKRGLGAKTLEAMRRHARRTQTPLAAASLDLCDTDELPARARNTLIGLLGQFVHWRELSEQITPSELLRTVIAESGYEDMLQKDRSAESAGRLENLTELARAMEEYDTLGDFLEHVSLVMDNERANDGEKVTIMTMHAAKGLEFDHVFLPGWEEGVFPSQRAIDEGGLASLEEERRLAYVAITRAKRRCSIFHAANRRIYGQWTSSIPSRFIEELPEEHVKSETTMTGGASLWRANWSETDDPFAHVSSNRPDRSGARGPGWQRALSTKYDSTPKRIAEPGRSAASFAAKPRSDIADGARVFHDKFGYGTVTGQEGNKLTIDFEKAGEKRVLDSFVTLAD